MCTKMGGSFNTGFRNYFKIFVRIERIENDFWTSLKMQHEPGSSVSIVSGYGLDDGAIEV
jgi:hypothetical protein